MLHDLRGYESERKALRANNLQPKLKQLSVVLTTVDTIKQGVSSAEYFEAIGDDYATCAVGRDTAIPYFKSHLRNQKNSNHLFGGLSFFLLTAAVALCFMTFGEHDERGSLG